VTDETSPSRVVASRGIEIGPLPRRQIASLTGERLFHLARPSGAALERQHAKGRKPRQEIPQNLGTCAECREWLDGLTQINGMCRPLGNIE